MSVSLGNQCNSSAAHGPERLAVVAMDWPNVWHTMQDISQSLNLGYLRKALQLDAAERLKAAPQQFTFEATAFLQSPDSPSLTSNYVRERLALEETGWSVITRVSSRAPEGDMELFQRLDELVRIPEMTQRGEFLHLHTYEDWDLFRDLAEELLARHGDSATKSQLRTLRTRPKQLLQRNPEYWDILMRVCLELCNRFLNERRQEQRQEFAQLVEALRASPMLGPCVNGADPLQVPDRDLADFMYRVYACARGIVRRDHHLRDIDMDLTTWVHEHFLWREPEDYQGVAYLVGDDYTNHLVVAERLERYRVPAVLVVSDYHFQRAQRGTQKSLQRYPLIWLDEFCALTGETLIAG